jgi:hypothetical protein
MEYLTISVMSVMSVIENDGKVRARTRATAQDARIDVEVTFEAGLHSSHEDLWQQARDEVLRYLGVS